MSKQQKTVLFSGLINVIVGGILLYSGSWIIETIMELIGILFLFIGVIHLIQVPKNLKLKSDRPILFKILDSVLAIFIGLFLMLKSIFPVTVLAGIIGVYILLVGLLKIFNFILLKNDRVKGYWWLLFSGICYTIIGINVFNLQIYTQSFYQWFGIYLILNGVSLLKEWVTYNHKKVVGKRRKRIGVPIIFTALISHDTLNKINAFINNENIKLSKSETEDIEDWLDINKNNQIKPDLEVWVHTSFKKGFDAVGHVDISYAGKTYSYGNYDVDSHKLFGTIGDGILYEINTTDYEKWIHNVDSRAVFRYGLSLTDEQKEIVEQQIQKIKSRTESYTLASKEQKNSYLGKLVREFPVAKIYKFKKSKFKTYFVLTTNCVLLADYIIGKIGIDIINRSGMITPGAYQQYFDNEYKKPNSFVTDRKMLLNNK